MIKHLLPFIVIAIPGTLVHMLFAADTTLSVHDTTNLPQLQKQIVSASLKKTALMNTPVLCDVISKDDIEAVSAVRVSDAIKYIPGMNVEHGTGSGGPFKKNVTINGMPNFYNVVMVDGMRLLSSHSQTGANIDMIPASAIERIEIIKDASSSLYGSDALGGVINIVTKKGTPTGEVDAAINYGSYKTWGGEVAGRGTLMGGITGYSLYAGYERSDGPDILAPAHRIGHLGYRKASFINRFDISPNDRIGITARLDLITDDAEFRDAMLTTADTVLIHPDSSKSTWYQVESEYDMLTAWLFTPGLEAKVALTDHLRLEFKGYYSQWLGEISSEDIELASERLLLTFNGVKNHEFTLGAEYLWNNYFRSGLPAQYDQHTGSGFIQYQGRFFTELLSVLASVRSDYVRNPFNGVLNTGPVFSPKLSLLVKPIAPLSVRASVSRGFKAPTVMELYEDRFHRSYYRLGNPDLKPEYSGNLAGGVSYTPWSFLEVSFNGYANFIDDMIIVTREPEDRGSRAVYKRYNLQEGRIYGIEGKVAFDHRWLHFLTGVSNAWQSTEGTLDIPYFPGVNFFSRLSCDHDFSDYFGAMVYAGYSTRLGREYWSFSSNEKSSLEDLHELEAGATLRIGGFAEIVFRAANLLGREHETYEDLLMKITGEPRFELRLQFNLK